MPASKTDKISVACPKCGHRQLEPRSAYSSLCKKCHQHFRLEEVLNPAAPPPKLEVEQRHIRCYQCGTDLSVPLAASSSMCRKCSAHVDLTDYRITQTVSKNFRTHGRLVIEEKGYVLNSDTIAGEAVVKGRFIGKLASAGTLELHSSANIKGTFSAGCLVIPAGHHFRWPEPIRVDGADIRGELVANMESKGTVRLGPAARFFGTVRARNFVVEAGAVFVGSARVGAAV